MSKMPAKKKSCFQITSVTTAQVASSSSITEDTESLDDPDESRTEDVSSEIFDVSRATDYGGHEEDPSCERSSSEETLNNVAAAGGDAVETPGTVSPNLVLDGQVAAATAAGGIQQPPPPVVFSPATNGGAVPRSSMVAPAPGGSSSGSSGPGAVPPTASSAATSAACSSRFRVIKLDHGSGEPYRRGRWTCMEYYDRDSDSGAVLARTGDCIRHNNNTFEQAVQDRDSGLGATGGGGSLMASGQDSLASDSSLAAVSPLLQPEKMSQQPPAAAQPATAFVIGQQQQQPIGGAVPPHSSSSSAQPVAYSGVQPIMGPSLLQAQPQVNTQGQAGPNGKGMPPSNVAIAQGSLPMQQVQQANVPMAQTQQFAYPQPQIPPVHLVPAAQTPGQPEYMQHMAVMPSQGATQQAIPGTVTSTGASSSLPATQVAGQNPPTIAPVMGAASQAGETVGQGSGLMQSGLTTPIQTVIAQPGGVVQQGMGHAGIVQQKSMTQQQMGGSSQVAGAPHTVVSGVQNVPAAVPGTSVPSVSTTSVTMPNAPVTLVQSQLTSHTSVSRSSSVVQQHIGLPLMQGATNVPTNLPQSNIGQFQTQPLGQIDDSRRKSEPLPQPPLSLVTENKLVKPPIPDALTNPLNLPATTPMNSLASSVFGISIPVDGDEDSASGASVVAIDNKIEQAMDLVKSHLMYAVREEVEVLKEQIKELVERNSLLERENALLKSLSNNDQLSQLSTQQANPSSTSQQQQTAIAQPQQPTQPPQQPNVSSA
ncbi:TSC22 domain family protein 2 isoform X2 [Sceloporus undulatus]|uniref:TSC22 domain family protein 2 isoform X2 n=1 Tax=Sceloporus undulatus TaxID=8520 RepID=UPI001C4C00A7|nr:TSC22 domain family protein 2 isoform X2 [Sceloporus undulatus]